MERFPEPVSGQVIPRGWFGRLVRFINSLILHGDGQYLTVKHTLDGQTITPTPALLQALGNGGAPPAASGGATGITAEISGSTATLSLAGVSGSTVSLIPGPGAAISGGTNAVRIGLSGSTTSPGFPDYAVQTTAVVLGSTHGPYAYPVWVIGYLESGYIGDGVQCASITVSFYRNSSLAGGVNLIQSAVPDDINGNQGRLHVPVTLPIPAGMSFCFANYDTNYGDIHAYIYPCV